jgi:zinc transport system substrate-binding protein
MIQTRSLLLATTAAALACSSTAALALDGVVASIKPVHSLVAGVMEGVAEPELIVTGANSPHTYSMRPSDAQTLQSAPAVFWIGPELEAFLADPVETLSGHARVVALGETDGLERLEYREGGAFAAHTEEEHAHAERHDHDHGHGDDHAHDHEDEAEGDHHHDHAAGDDHEDHAEEASAADHDDHAHDDDAHAGAEGHDSHDAHAHGQFDTHYWLDPSNAAVMVDEIAATLSQLDPQNGETYVSNAARMKQEIADLDREIASQMEPLAGRPFVVFHDAYHYFEDRYGLEAAGAITINPETPPSAARIAELQARIGELEAVCVFSEPQFDPQIVTVLTEGTDARSGVLDPEGAALTDGPELYFELLRDMAASFRECLAEPA